MFIIIPKFFEKDFYGIFPGSKYLIKFLKSLKEKENDLIKLNVKYKKYKFNLVKLSIRGIIYIEIIENSGQLVYHPIWIDKKSTKESQSGKRGKIGGYNITLDKKTLNFLGLRVSKLKSDLINGDFERYEILNENGIKKVYKIDTIGNRISL